MRNVWAIATRELRSYFLSPLAYLVAAFFVFGSGLLFWLILQAGREASLTGLIQNIHVLFLFVIPMIGMLCRFYARGDAALSDIPVHLRLARRWADPDRLYRGDSAG